MALVPEPKSNTSHYGAIALTCFKSINQLFTACQVCNWLPRDHDITTLPHGIMKHGEQMMLTSRCVF